MAKDHDDTTHNETTPKNTHEIRAHKAEGGGAMKWIAGAAVVALLAGGGYYLMSKPSSAPQQQAAMSDTFDNSATTQSPAAETASAPSESSSNSAPRRVASNAPTEEVVGVTTASTSAGDSEDIIVPASRRPVWAQRPNARRLSESYPYRALERGQEGEASVSCTVGQSGAMSCVKVSEQPANAGFGAAAVHVAQMYRHAAYRADGAPAVGTPVNLRVLFRQGEDGRAFNQ
jgi:TonB family protein